MVRLVDSLKCYGVVYVIPVLFTVLCLFVR